MESGNDVPLPIDFCTCSVKDLYEFLEGEREEIRLTLQELDAIKNNPHFQKTAPKFQGGSDEYITIDQNEEKGCITLSIPDEYGFFYFALEEDR